MLLRVGLAEQFVTGIIALLACLGPIPRKRFNIVRTVERDLCCTLRMVFPHQAKVVFVRPFCFVSLELCFCCCSIVEYMNQSESLVPGRESPIG